MQVSHKGEGCNKVMNYCCNEVCPHRRYFRSLNDYSGHSKNFPHVSKLNGNQVQCITSVPHICWVINWSFILRGLLSNVQDPTIVNRVWECAPASSACSTQPCACAMYRWRFSWCHQTQSGLPASPLDRHQLWSRLVAIPGHASLHLQKHRCNPQVKAPGRKYMLCLQF